MKNLFWSKSPPDLWNLLNLETEVLRQIYPGSKHIRTTKLRYQRMVREGDMEAPPRNPEWDGNPAEERLRAEKRRRTAKTAGSTVSKSLLVTIQVPEEHLPYHQKLQEALDSDGRVEKATFREGSHRGYIKNADNEIEYTEDMPNRRVEFAVSFDVEPKFPPILPIKGVSLPKREKLAPTKAKKAVVLSDMQIPYHDLDAFGVALDIVRDVKPDTIVMLGDLLDLDAFSDFSNIPLSVEYSTNTQAAIVEAHKVLELLRRACPSAEIAVLEGNHDARITTNVLKHNKAAFGLRKATDPEGWPVLSVPHLCDFDSLDVRYVSGYPANRYWINERLQVQHGHRVRTSGSTAKLVSDNERVSTIFGHVHRLESQFKTHPTYHGNKTNAAFGIGCLCRLDGSVPSKNRGIDLFGKPVGNQENWQQAIAVVDYEEGDAPFTVTPVFINTWENYQAVYGGKTYQKS